MLSLEEGLRSFWLPGLHSVTGRKTETVAQWLLRRDFVIASVGSPAEFSLRVLVPDALMASIAHDCSQMSCAAFETFFGISDSKRLPRSCGWTNIAAYYGAFFAAHAILRMFGTMCIQLESPQCNAIEKEALSLGLLPPSGFENGFYEAIYEPSLSELRLKKSAADKKGSHRVLWDIFVKRLRFYSDSLLAVSALYTEPALYLSEVADILCQNGPGGAWLSNVRNAINYRQEFGAWYPYKSLSTDRRALVAITSQWRKHPMKIKLIHRGDTLLQHVSTSTAITSLCHLIVSDFAALGGPRSFQSFGPLALASLATQTAA